MASELAMAYAWIDSTLRADSALMAASSGGVWQGAADIGTLPPFTLYARQSDLDVQTVNAVRIYASLLIQIKAIGPASVYSALVTIANRIDALFDGKRNVGLPVGGVLESYREGQFELPEVIAPGVLWTSLGGLYRINVQGY